MTTKNTLLGSAAIVLALSLGSAQAQTPSKNDDMNKAPASAQAEKQKAASDSSKDAHKNAEPARSDTTKSDMTKSGSISGSDQRAQDPSKSDAAKSTTGQNKATETNSSSSKSDDMKTSDSKPSAAAKDATSNDSSKKADSKASDSKASEKSAGSDSARKPQNGTAGKADPNAAKAASDAKPDAAKSAQSRNDSSRAAAAAPAVSKHQETKISAAISSTKVEPVTKVDFSVSIGTAVPSHVHLHPLPATIVSIVPEYRGYEFFVVREEIIIVEPRTKKIVKVIERSGPSHASTTSTRSEKMKLSDKDRATLRKSARSGQHATTGSSRTTTVTVGERLPASVEITEFPDEVYREVPAVRSYRYYSTDRGLYLIDPSDRTVIEEVD